MASIRPGLAAGCDGTVSVDLNLAAGLEAWHFLPGLWLRDDQPVLFALHLLHLLVLLALQPVLGSLEIAGRIKPGIARADFDRGRFQG
ncbi:MULTISPECIES: hypothetical protein [unclassified Mesorhizobium]|uniref:hypothetical protein n=1 Tax=unclassified Mesorhizobium TaxID=325217 RepID=UPI0012E3C9AF|nr:MULTISPECIES: hypothetical protein [unclassified Mesorhizobium]